MHSTGLVNSKSSISKTVQLSPKKSYFSYLIHATTSKLPIQAFTNLCVKIISAIGASITVGLKGIYGVKNKVFSIFFRTKKSNQLQQKLLKEQPLSIIQNKTPIISSPLHLHSTSVKSPLFSLQPTPSSVNNSHPQLTSPHLVQVEQPGDTPRISSPLHPRSTPLKSPYFSPRTVLSSVNNSPSQSPKRSNVDKKSPNSPLSAIEKNPDPLLMNLPRPQPLQLEEIREKYAPPTPDTPNAALFQPEEDFLSCERPKDSSTQNPPLKPPSPPLFSTPNKRSSFSYIFQQGGKLSPNSANKLNRRRKAISSPDSPSLSTNASPSYVCEEESKKGVNTPSSADKKAHKSRLTLVLSTPRRKLKTSTERTNLSATPPKTPQEALLDNLNKKYHPRITPEVPAVKSPTEPTWTP